MLCSTIVVSSYYEGEYFWDYHVNARHCHALVFLEVSPFSALSNCLFMKKKQIKLRTTKFRKLDEFPEKLHPLASVPLQYILRWCRASIYRCI